jgi:hypothetical protein
MAWGNWGNPDDVNKALKMTGSDYQVPPPVSGIGGNPTALGGMTNDDRRAMAEANGMKAVAEGGGGGGGKGGMLQSLMGGAMGGGGGEGGGGLIKRGTVANAGGAPYQAPPVGETQAQNIERQFALRNEAEKARKEQLFSLAGKFFGF